MSRTFPFRLHGRRFVIATALAEPCPSRRALAAARGRRWVRVQIRRRADDQFLGTELALIDACGRILKMQTLLGQLAWSDVDNRRMAPRLRQPLAPDRTIAVNPAAWDEVAATRGFARIDEPRRLDWVEFDPSGRPMFMLPPAARAWSAMRAAARDTGIVLQAISSFRSIAHQRALVLRKLARGDVPEQVFSVNAVPGYSEHHSGRAVDIGTPGCPALEEAFERTPAFAWLQQHAASFGFRLSYPRDNALGVIYEPWHWCYSSVAERCLEARPPA